MTYDSITHYRRSIRLPGYDYRMPGAYFITLVCINRDCLFGSIQQEAMALSPFGELVGEAWQWLARQYAYVELDEWVIMPNHMHAILWIVEEEVGAGCVPQEGLGGSSGAFHETPLRGKRKPLGQLIGAFKTVSTKEINQLRNMPGEPLWQRNYYEHIIRNDQALNKIRAYITNNPAQWDLDHENPHPP